MIMTLCDQYELKVMAWTDAGGGGGRGETAKAAHSCTIQTVAPRWTATSYMVRG